MPEPSWCLHRPGFALCLLIASEGRCHTHWISSNSEPVTHRFIRTWVLTYDWASEATEAATNSHTGSRLHLTPHLCACVLASNSKLNLTTSLISSYPTHPPVPTPGFSFNEMFWSLHKPFSLSPWFYPFLSFSSGSSFVSPSFIVFGFLSVISLGKVIKGQHIEGALLCRVVVFSCALLFVFYFLFVVADLIGKLGAR